MSSPGPIPQTVDVVVVGLGPGGLRAATLLAKAGLEVVGIEDRLVGGECRFYGCTPSKMLVRSADLVRESRRAAELMGGRPVEPQWRPVAERIAKVGANHWDDSDTVASVEKVGLTVVRGRARLEGDGRVAVDGRAFQARTGIVVAVGTAPSAPDVDGLDQTPFLTNRDVFQLASLPSSMICLGGGPIGVEISQAMQRLGVETTLLEAASRVLGAEEPEASRVLAEAMRGEGVNVLEGVALDRVEQTADGVRVVVGDDVYEAERLLVAAGREICVDGLGLDAAGIQTSEDGAVDVDNRLRAGPGVWAVGDVTGKGPYTHVAEYQAEIAAADILGRDDRPRAAYHAVPRLVFGDPEIAAVGLTEQDARDRGIPVQTACVDIDASSRAWLHDSECVGLVKLVADGGGTLVGATVVAPVAAEMLGQLTLAVHLRASLDQLGSMLYAFPSFHDAVRAAVHELRPPSAEAS